MSVVLSVSNLSKAFKIGFIPRRIIALEGLSFEVEKGEIFGLLGPNGAGKTTALKCILSLVKADSGKIELLGKPIPSLGAKHKIGFLAENPYVYDFLNPREYLIFCARLHGLNSISAEKKAEELLAFFHLDDAVDRPLRKFSKGMLQRIGLAQALLNDPEFLILDEPMSGLDPVGRKEVRDLMLSLKNQGKTILFSSHILSDAELLCDRVAIIVNGKMKSIGKLQALLKHIEGYEVLLSNLKNASIQEIPHEVVAVSDGQYLLRVPSIDAIDALMALSRTEKFQIESILPQRQSLEDLYLKQMK